MRKQAAHTVFFLVPPEVHLLDLTGPAHLFYEANAYGANIALRYLSLDGQKESASSAGVSLGTLASFQGVVLTKNDLLFVPGFESHLFFDSDFVAKHDMLLSWLKRQAAQGARICSVCTGAYLLGYAGLLEEKECTTHWKYFKDFRTRFPKAKVLSDRLLVKDGRLYSSAGVSSGIDLALYILEELFGALLAAKVAKEVVIYARRTENDPQLSVFLQYRNHVENRIHEVQDFLSQHLSYKHKILDLADSVHMSARNLTRLFKKTTGITIGEYLEKLRVEHAVQLLSANSKVETAAHACGFQSSNQLRTLLKKHRSALPSQLRMYSDA